MCDFETVGTGFIDEAKVGSQSPYKAFSDVVRALRNNGYYSAPLEFVVLNYLEGLAQAKAYKEELSWYGFNALSLHGKSCRELSELLAEQPPRKERIKRHSPKGG